MFTRNVMAVTALCLLTAQIVMADDNPQLGENVSPADLDGSGSAVEGAKVYQDKCLACHGAGGKDGLNDVLVGGHGSLTTDRPRKTVGSYWPYATTLFDFVRRAMPYQAPGSLSDDEVYAVTAYILYLNDVVSEDDQLDADTLPDVLMPNRDNFVWAYSPD